MKINSGIFYFIFIPSLGKAAHFFLMQPFLSWPQTSPVWLRGRKVSFPSSLSPHTCHSCWFSHSCTQPALGLNPHHWAAKPSTCQPKISPVSIRSVYPGPIPSTPEAIAPSLS